MAPQPQHPLPLIPQYRAAAIQYAPTLFEKEKNLLEQQEMVEEAARNEAKLIVMVEMATTAYCFYSRAEISPYVEPIPGPTTEMFGEIASHYGCYVVVGMPEVDPETNIYYNSLALIGPSGVIGKYRKTHSYISENTWAKDGDLGLPVFSTEIGNLGGLICMDASFPETARLLALRRADVICFPTNWLLEKAPAPSWLTRAFENGVYLVAADRWGNERTVEFSGGSAIIDPDGSIQSHKDTGNGIVYGIIDVERARDKGFGNGGKGNKLLERRPGEYMDLVRNSYLFNPNDYFGLYGQGFLPPGRSSRIGVVQMASVQGDAETNLSKIEVQLDSLPERCDIVVLPELAVTGVVEARPQARSVAEKVGDGPTVRQLLDLARRHDTYLVTSIVEDEGGRLYNTALLAGPEGLVGRYRKLHLSESDRAWATPGDMGLPTFDIAVGRVGLLVGHDAMFPEPARALAVKGADLICVPGALKYPGVSALGPTLVPLAKSIVTGPDPVHWHILRSRSEENNTFVAFANQCGDGYFGRSGVFDKQGDGSIRHEVVASEADEEVVSLEVTTDQVEGVAHPTSSVRIKEMVRMRQTYWYSLLVHQDPPVMNELCGNRQEP
ncbi:MAG: nitrilase-related carbon-nitrogen hydrolase [Dehalococcoidia bacterium]